jgi:hypothetical protein
LVQTIEMWLHERMMAPTPSIELEKARL